MKISEADILGGLTVGNAKSVIEGKKNSPLGNLLVELNQAIIDDLQTSIKNRDIDASRNLSQGITPSDVIINGNEIEVNISMDFFCNGCYLFHSCHWRRSFCRGKQDPCNWFSPHGSFVVLYSVFGFCVHLDQGARG